jgi:hypothetical protein
VSHFIILFCLARIVKQMELSKPDLLLKELKDSSFVPQFNVVSSYKNDLVKKLIQDYNQLVSQIEGVRESYP